MSRAYELTRWSAVDWHRAEVDSDGEMVRLEDAARVIVELEAKVAELEDGRRKCDGLRRPTSPIEAMIDKACGVTDDQYSGSKPKRAHKTRKYNG